MYYENYTSKCLVCCKPSVFKNVSGYFTVDNRSTDSWLVDALSMSVGETEIVCEEETAAMLSDYEEDELE